jgi:hypothetical protein
MSKYSSQRPVHLIILVDSIMRVEGGPNANFTQNTAASHQNEG